MLIFNLNILVQPTNLYRAHLPKKQKLTTIQEGPQQLVMTSSAHNAVQIIPMHLRNNIQIVPVCLTNNIHIFFIYFLLVHVGDIKLQFLR